MDKEMSIVEWYRDKRVFVTGGTGFMGKVLLEKLLRGCPDVHRIYILVRPKRGVTPSTRVEEITKLPLFEKLRVTNPGALNKLTALEGDITLPDLGLSEENRRLLEEEVDIVFHCAASLRLEAEIKLAVEHNTLATLRLLQLCRGMKNLQALIHLSTAFCHCDELELEEKVYPSPADPHDVIKLVQWLDDDTLRNLTPRLLGPHPNCYTYSKRLAESLVAQEKDHMPVAIIRPSAVLPVYQDPLPGWVDTLNGPIGVLVGAGKGVIRSMMCNQNYQAEMIPVDIAINAMIAVAYKTATHK
uniref:Fatty acyl-CoA reductase n=1 Tax=Timema genevievae TaxID=629358 RepID=A0A7R9JVH5_TIMGE|nr:unnamed protein product [Timema genevievae]